MTKKLKDNETKRLAARYAKARDAIAAFGSSGDHSDQHKDYVLFGIECLEAECLRARQDLRRPTDTPFPREWVQKVKVGALLKVVDRLADGGLSIHTVLALIAVGLPEDIAEMYEDFFVSDPAQGLMGVIFDSSGPVAYLQGISGLRLLRDINGGLGLPGSTSLGRGSEARELAEQIRKHLNTP